MYVIRVACRQDVAAAVSDRLWALGCAGIAETVDGDAERVTLLVGFAHDVPLDRLTRVLREVDGSLDVAPEPSVESTWRAHAQPVTVGPFHLRLPEHPAAPPDLIDLVIEPGDAFGSGSHESTRLALATLAELDLAGRAVADVGTGTGVLAIAAQLLGASPVDAVDIDPGAVDVARHNLSTHKSSAVVTWGTASDLAAAAYGVIVANLTIDIQREVAVAMSSRLAEGGVIVLSGLLGSQVDDAAAAYPGFGTVDRRDEGEWACVVLGRR